MPNPNPTESKYTPINLMPGVDLMVRADMVDTVEARRLVDHLTEHLDRGNRERELRGYIAQVLTHPEADELGMFPAVLEIMGWHSNFTDRTAAQLAAAIEALIPLASPLDLVHACEVAQHEIQKPAYTVVRS